MFYKDIRPRRWPDESSRIIQGDSSIIFEHDGRDNVGEDMIRGFAGGEGEGEGIVDECRVTPSKSARGDIIAEKEEGRRHVRGVSSALRR